MVGRPVWVREPRWWQDKFKRMEFDEDHLVHMELWNKYIKNLRGLLGPFYQPGNTTTYLCVVVVYETLEGFLRVKHMATVVISPISNAAFRLSSLACSMPCELRRKNRARVPDEREWMMWQPID